MAASEQNLPSAIRTRILILSDSHGKHFEASRMFQERVDIAIHCGDLTDGSRMEEFRATIQLLKLINAPLKLIIAGNHDFTLDDAAFDRMKTEADRVYQGTLGSSVVTELGRSGAARDLLLEARDDGIVYLEEGLHQFVLDNGAILKVYASPYTPSSGWTWGFQYTGAHDFQIPPGIDIAMTHGPPLGIWDKHRDCSESPPKVKRIGCPQLFRAIAKAQPRLHCFGHVHSDWGARLVTWRPHISDSPSHFTDIDNEKSLTIESLQRLEGETLQQYKNRSAYRISHCEKDENPVKAGKTLFVNASVMGQEGVLDQLPWLVEIDLERHLAASS